MGEAVLTVREMSALEAMEHFAEIGQRGLLAEHAGEVQGWVGFNLDDQGLYGHSMFCRDEGVACAALCQALRQMARDLNQPQIRFVVNAENPHFLRLVESGRAVIHSYVVSVAL